MVTPHNPLKEEASLMSDEFRLKLVQLAIGGYPKFRASDFEFHLPRPSYTCLLYTSAFCRIHSFKFDESRSV